MPFIEEASAFMFSARTHELRYNKQHKTLGLVSLQASVNAEPDQGIEYDRVAGSVSTLARTIHHDLSAYYTNNLASTEEEEEVETMRRKIGNLVRCMNHWIKSETRSDLVAEMEQYTAGSDPLGWLVDLFKPASGIVWRLFLTFLCMYEQSTEPDEEDMLRLFVMMHIQAMYRIYLSLVPRPDPFPLSTFGLDNTAAAVVMSDSMWLYICVALDELEPYDCDVDPDRDRTRRHREMVEDLIDTVDDLGLVDDFADGVDPVVVWVALVKAVETDDNENDNEDEDGGGDDDDEEVTALSSLFLAVAVFDVGHRPAEAEAMMGCYTRSVFHPAVKEAIRRRADEFPAWTVAEPFRSRLGMLSE